MVSLPAREGKRNSFCARIARHLLNPKLCGVEQYVSTRFRSGKPGKWTRTARGGLLSGLLIAVRRMLESFYAQVPGHGSVCACDLNHKMAATAALCFLSGGGLITPPRR